MKLKYLLYLAMAVIIFFSGFYIVNKKAAELQKETAVSQNPVTENSDTSIKKNRTHSIPISDQKKKKRLRGTEHNVTKLQESTEAKTFDEAKENNDPNSDRPPTIHPDEKLDKIGLNEIKLNQDEIAKLRSSMENDGIAKEDIENMLGLTEESDRRNYTVEQSVPTSPEELENELITSFIEAGVSSEDMEIMLKDLLHGIEASETSDNSHEPGDSPLPQEAERNEEIPNQESSPNN